MSFKKESLGEKESALKQSAAQESIYVTARDRGGHKSNPNS